MKHDSEGKGSYIEVIPFGKISQVLLSYISKVIEEKFKLPSKIRQFIPVPRRIFDQARGQYNAGDLLTIISKIRSHDSVKTLGVIDEDIFSKGLNFVFGQAILGGCCGVISLSRLRAGTNRPGGERLFLERVKKEAVHELGHAFGLRHCSDPRCVMYFSSDLSDTDRKSADFCEKCGRPMHLLRD